MKTVLAKCGWLCTLFCYLTVFAPSYLLLPDTGSDLLSAVQTVQRLSYNTFFDAGFRTVFAQAFDSMQEAAGLKSLADNSTAGEDNTVPLMVAVARPPHIVSKHTGSPLDLLSTDLPPSIEVWTYRSIFLPPDTPPPIPVSLSMG